MNGRSMKLNGRRTLAADVGRREAQQFLSQLGVREEDLIPVAYVDLMVSNGFRT